MLWSGRRRSARAWACRDSTHGKGGDFRYGVLSIVRSILFSGARPRGWRCWRGWAHASVEQAGAGAGLLRCRRFSVGRLAPAPVRAGRRTACDSCAHSSRVQAGLAALATRRELVASELACGGLRRFCFWVSLGGQLVSLVLKAGQRQQDAQAQACVLVPADAAPPASCLKDHVSKRPSLSLCRCQG